MAADPELRRSLGLPSAVSIVVGSVIGSGIFLQPWEVARRMGSPDGVYAIWIGVGLVCLFGALAYAELGTLFPEAGGQYAFLREAYGKLPAFLYGWCLLFVINSGTIAGLSVAFASSLATVTSLDAGTQVAISAAMILFLAAVNHFGVERGAAVQNLSTAAKLGALAAIIVGGGLLLARGAVPTPPPGDLAPPGDLLPAVIAAAVAVFWAYEGWYQLPFSAAELRRPERDLPRGLLIGVGILIVTYVTVNVVFMNVVPLAELRGMTSGIEVPRRTIERVFGPILGGAGGDALAILICVSVLGAANACLLSPTRAMYAMARDGLLPRALTRVHPRHRTPTVAIWSQAAWAIALVVVLRTFRDITEYVVFAALLFYALTAAAVYVFRVRAPDRPRSFRCPGYPVTPALFIAAVLLVDLFTLADPEKRGNALVGLGILASAVPIYWLVTRRAPRGG